MFTVPIRKVISCDMYCRPFIIVILNFFNSIKHVYEEKTLLNILYKAFYKFQLGSATDWPPPANTLSSR